MDSDGFSKWWQNLNSGDDVELAERERELCVFDTAKYNGVTIGLILKSFLTPKRFSFMMFVEEYSIHLSLFF